MLDNDKTKQAIPNLGGISNEKFIDLYREMWLIRLFEEKIEELFFQGEIYGTMHLCIGQEATAVGSACLLRNEDWMTSTHRNHGHSIAKGTDLRGMFAEILGRKTGTNQGKGGSMHIADMAVGNLGSNGIVGGNFPIATGAALTAQLKGTDQVVMCYSGDGSTNEGSFHEALNLASIWQLPVIFFIENNQYGMSSSVKDMVNIEHISMRSQSYGIPGVTIDGNDIVQVINTTKKAIDRARQGNGPTLIEAHTYRYRGHSKSDKCAYRTQEEEAEWRLKNDPIAQMEKLLLAYEVITHSTIDKIKKEIQEELDEIVQSVLADDRPSETDLYTHVYAE